MNLNELLALAAKAAGYRVKRESPDGLIVWIDGGPWLWNPLTDDGDRYRLARDCGLRINFAGNEVSWPIKGTSAFATLRWPEDGDEANCIVRVAAEIGMGMK